MNNIPQRNSLISQVVDILIEKINEKTWGKWLPSERALCASLHVSRNTLRAALSHLKEQNIIKSIHPIGTKIIGNSPNKPQEISKTIGILAPVAPENMRPHLALIIDRLRGDLAEIGYLLHIHCGEHFFRSNAPAALDKLVKRHTYACWLLMLAEEHVKQWFYKNKINCVVSGSCQPDHPLPFVDVDFRALCRHAVGQILAAGHRDIALLLDQSKKGGDLDSEQGFNEGIEQTKTHDVSHRIIRHQGNPESIGRTLSRIFSAKSPPTAIIICNPYIYLYTHTWLQSQGLRIPDDISLVCRDNDFFLQFIYPRPSYYGINPQIFACKLFKLILETINSGGVPPRSIRIMPDYEKGDSLSAIPPNKVHQFIE